MKLENNCLQLYKFSLHFKILKVNFVMAVSVRFYFLEISDHPARFRRSSCKIQAIILQDSGDNPARFRR